VDRREGSVEVTACSVLLRIARAVADDPALEGRTVGVVINERHLDAGRTLLHLGAIDALVHGTMTDVGVVLVRDVREGDVDLERTIDAAIGRALPEAQDMRRVELAS
jgi:hypothetical protein